MKEIKLTNSDKVAIVDDEDYDRLLKCPCGYPYYWRKKPNGGNSFYAVRTPVHCDVGIYPSKTHIKMHNEVIVPANGMVVDHINHNGLDNRRENLRACSQQENLQNRPKWGKNKYRGVQKNGRKFSATIQNKYIGLYATAEEAAKAFNRKARELYGEFAVLNPV